MALIKRVFSGEIKDINIGEQTLTAVISTNSVDRMGEVLDPKGVDMKNFQKNPIVAWAHDYKLLPIGKALWTKKVQGGIMSKVKFASHAFAQEVFNLYREGFLKAFSVGFIPKDWEDGDGKKTPFRTYTKWELLEYSAVPIPANPEALSLAMTKGIIHEAKIIEDIQNAIDHDNKDLHCPECDSVELEVETIDNKDNFNCKGCDHRWIIKGEEGDDEDDDEDDDQEEKGLEDLLAENKLLAEEVNGLKNDNSDLRFKLYQEMEARQKALSEISDGISLDKIQSHIDGEIRKMTGKV